MPLKASELRAVAAAWDRIRARPAVPPRRARPTPPPPPPPPAPAATRPEVKVRAPRASLREAIEAPAARGPERRLFAAEALVVKQESVTLAALRRQGLAHEDELRRAREALTAARDELRAVVERATSTETHMVERLRAAEARVSAPPADVGPFYGRVEWEELLAALGRPPREATPEEAIMAVCARRYAARPWPQRITRRWRLPR